jgi:hypothetical protein
VDWFCFWQLEKQDASAAESGVQTTVWYKKTEAIMQPESPLLPFEQVERGNAH